MSHIETHWLASKLYQEGLIDSENQQVLFRGAVGRAYYAAFYSAIPLSKKCPFASKTSRGTHAQVIESLMGIGIGVFDKTTVMDIRRTGYILNQLKSCRVDADYKLDEIFQGQETSKVVDDSDKVIKLTYDLLQRI